MTDGYHVITGDPSRPAHHLFDLLSSAPPDSPTAFYKQPMNISHREQLHVYISVCFTFYWSNSILKSCFSYMSSTFGYSTASDQSVVLFGLT